MGYKNNNALSHYSMDVAIDMATRCVVRDTIGKACEALAINVGGYVSNFVNAAVGDAVNDAVRSAVGYAVRDAVTEVEK